MQTAARSVSVAALRAPVLAQPRSNAPVTRSIGLRPARPAARRGPPAVSAVGRPSDLDGTLQYVADKWEATENKGTVGAYVGGAVAAIFVAEWLIHLPLFNVLLGFPIQFVGLLTVVNLGLSRFVDKKGSLWDDAEGLVDNVSKQLPGLGK